MSNTNENEILVSNIFLDKRLKFFYIFIFLIAGLVLFRVYNVMFTAKYIIPSNLLWMAREPQQIKYLNEHLEELNKLSENIELYSIGDIKDTIANTIVLVNRSNKELNSQYEAWLTIKNVMESDRESFNLLRDELSDIQGIKTDRLLAVKKVIDESLEPDLIDITLSYFVAFVLGSASSFMASIAYKRYSERKI
jgi:hypothetical protein